MHGLYGHRDARPLTETVSSPAVPWSLTGQVSAGGGAVNPATKGRPSENGGGPAGDPEKAAQLGERAALPRGLAWTGLEGISHQHTNGPCAAGACPECPLEAS